VQDWASGFMAEPLPPDGPVLVDPGNSFRIGAIWAFLSVDEKGDESVCAGPLGGLPVVPFIAADERRLDGLRPLAESLATLTKKRIVLVRFDRRVELETIEPGGGRG
jgi:hypothetical protein